MSDTIAVESMTRAQVDPFIELMAHEPFWAVFTPARDPKDDTVPIEVRARWTTVALDLWAERARMFLETEDPESERDRGLELLMESLSHAANAMLGFRRRDSPNPTPNGLLKVAYLLFVQAEERGVQAGDQTVYHVARRLSATRSPGERSETGFTIDELGRVFRASGERMFEANGAKILLGRQQIREGKFSTLKEIREAEARDER